MKIGLVISKKMYTKKQAQEKIQKFIDYKNDSHILNYEFNADIIIYEELTEELDFCWIFFWNVRNSNKDNSLIGNGPIIIEKDSLDMYMMATGLSVEDNLKEFKKNKDYLSKLEEDEDGNWDFVNIEFE